ncbi:MAG: carboxypeptidase-like regulatory domain-containing protein [Planctomycetota bacterium]
MPLAPATGGFVDAVSAEVELADGDRETVRIELPATGAPRHPRVVTDAPEDLAAWRARAVDGDWVALLPDGTIPIDLQGLNWGRLEIEADRGRRWEANMPLDAEDGYGIHLALEGPRYEGLLVDLATGAPLPGVQVVAFVERGRFAPSTVTDEVGRFTLVCERPFPHRLTFNDRGERPGWDNSHGDLYGVAYQVAVPPGGPDLLTIRIPRLRDGRFRGLAAKRLSRRIRGPDGTEPLVAWEIGFFCLQPDAQGTLELWRTAYLTTTSAEGGYEVELPDVARYRILVFRPGDRTAVLTETWEGVAGAEETHDFVVR